MYFRYLAVSILVLSWPACALAADFESLVRECDGCHGPRGVSTDSDIPSIAGKVQAMTERALRQFQSMARPCKRTTFRHGDTARPQTTMCSISANLDDEITALSRHYSDFEFRPARQAFNAPMAVAGANLHSLYCESCHPAGGSEAGYAGRLAGQWVPYLERTIGQIRSGELIVPHIMEKKLSDFSEDEIDLLLNFWASQQD